MIGLFTPRYIQDGREMLKAARKMLNYKRDLLRSEDVAALEAGMGDLGEALAARDPERVSAAGQKLDNLFAGHFPRREYSSVRENCEVFLVAIVIAVGVRSFFLQPFTIPTGSMQPTLNGILSFVTEEPPPNPLTQALHFAIYGRNYVNIVSQADDEIVSLRDIKRFAIFNFAEVQCKNQRFTVHVPAQKLRDDFDVKPGRPIKAGEIVARGYVNTGDHVFVDKASYHFRNPHRGEIFVFNTAGILTRENQENPGGPSQFYIKRLAGLPGDELRIDPPNLFVNGERADEYAFLRVMSLENGYHGYSNAPARGYPFPYLGSPHATFKVPEKSYFALGDNSYNSSDSRQWGIVPENNLMGRGLFVYWPFNSHWGFMK